MEIFYDHKTELFWAANLIGAAGYSSLGRLSFGLSDDSHSSSNPSTTASRSHRDFWNDWPNDLTHQMNDAREQRLRRLSAVTTPAQAHARIEMARTKFWELLGGPLEKQPLNPKITGQLERKGYRIEKLIYESLPQVYVTANLYVPTTGKPPFPAILAPVGHSSNGKAYPHYQHFYQNMALQGYVVFTYDPWGQGERIQYMPYWERQRRLACNPPHSHMG